MYLCAMDPGAFACVEEAGVKAAPYSVSIGTTTTTIFGAAPSLGYLGWACQIRFGVPTLRESQYVPTKLGALTWVLTGRGILGGVSSRILPKFRAQAWHRSAAMTESSPTGADGRLQRISPTSEVELCKLCDVCTRPFIPGSEPRTSTGQPSNRSVIPIVD